MKPIFTILVTLFAFAANAQSAVKTNFTTTLAADNIAVEGTQVFTQQSSANGVLFSAQNNAAAKRISITNAATGEIVVSHTFSVSNEFSAQKATSLELEIAPISTERAALELED